MENKIRGIIMIKEYISNVQFNICTNEIDIDKLRQRFKEPLKYINPSVINYIEVIEPDEIYIYIDGVSEKEFTETAYQFSELLNIFGFDAFRSDQDYGTLDVIVINEW